MSTANAWRKDRADLEHFQRPNYNVVLSSPLMVYFIETMELFGFHKKKGTINRLMQTIILGFGYE